MNIFIFANQWPALKARAQKAIRKVFKRVQILSNFQQKKIKTCASYHLAIIKRLITKN